jgi:hypothetical protein
MKYELLFNTASSASPKIPMSEDAANKPRIVETFEFAGSPPLDLNTSCIGLLFYLLLAQRRGPLGDGGSQFEPGRGSGASVGLIINLATPHPLLSHASTPLIHASSISLK